MGEGSPADASLSEVFERLADEADKARVAEVWGWSTEAGLFFGPAHPGCHFCVQATEPSWTKLRATARICFRHADALMVVEGTPPSGMAVPFVGH